MVETMSRNYFNQAILGFLSIFRILLFLRFLTLPSLASSATSTLASSVNSIITVAGTGDFGSSGTGGLVTAANLDYPISVTMDASGSYVYILEQDGNCVRRFSVTSNILESFAGVCGSGGIYAGDGGPATSAMLNHPSVNVMRSDNVLTISDYFNKRVRSVAVNNGIIKTTVGTGEYESSGDGGQATAAGISFPSGIWWSSVGVLYVGLLNDYVVRSVSSSGIISLFAGTGVNGYSGDGGPATAAEIGVYGGVRGDSSGVIYMCDVVHYRVRQVSTVGIISTLVGSGDVTWYDNVPASSAGLTFPFDVSIEPSNGDVYISAYNLNRIVVLTRATDRVTTIVGTGTAFSSGDGGPATAAKLNHPMGIYLTNSGELLINEMEENKVRKVFPTSVSTMSPTCFPTALPSGAPLASSNSETVPAAKNNSVVIGIVVGAFVLIAFFAFFALYYGKIWKTGIKVEPAPLKDVELVPTGC